METLMTDRDGAGETRANACDDTAAGTGVDTVLLVDDDPEFGALLSRACARVGVSIGQMIDATDLADKIPAESVRLVLVDLKMNDPTGVEWNFAGLSSVVELRRRFGGAFRIWVVSGLWNPVLEERAKAAGADAYLCKDRPLEEMADAVADAVA